MEKQSFKIFIIYQDSETAKAAFKTYDRLAGRLKSDFELLGNVWHLDALAYPHIQKKAFKQAEDSQLIIFSHHKDCKLSPPLQEWIESLLSGKDESSAFLSLCKEGVNNSRTAPSYAYFNQLMKKVKITFFSQFWSPDENLFLNTATA